MALKRAGMFKTVQGNTDLTLEAQANESFRVRDIFIYNPASSYINVYVDKVQVGYFRVGGNLGNHLPFPLQDEENSSLFGFLVNNDLMRPYPVPSGMTLKITGAAQANAIQVVMYDEYDSNDVQANEANGPEASEYDYINYGRYSTVLASGDNLYETQQTPSQFPAFPFGKTVPSGHRIKISGVLASDYGERDGTGAQGTTYIKFVKNRKTLFDDDLNGSPFFGSVSSTASTNFGQGQTVFGNYSDVDQRRPWVFDEPLIFDGGDDLDLFVTTTLVSGAATIAAADAEVALIQTVMRERGGI